MALGARRAVGAATPCANVTASMKRRNLERDGIEVSYDDVR